VNAPLVTLDGVTDLLTDGTHYTPKDVGEGFPFLTVKDLSEDGLDFIGCSRIAASEFENAKKQNSAPEKGDILFSKDGTVGKVHLVREDQPFAVLSSLAILRPSAKIDGAYLAHFLRTPSSIEAAGNKKTGSAIRRIVLRDLATLGLVVIVGIRPRFGGLARRSNRVTQLFQLVVEILLVGEQLRQFAVLGVEFRLLRLELHERLLQHLVAARCPVRVDRRRRGIGGR
jgi:hypothetical protein